MINGKGLERLTNGAIIQDTWLITSAATESHLTFQLHRQSDANHCLASCITIAPVLPYYGIDIWASRRTFIKHSLVLQHDRGFSKQWIPAFKASSIHPESLMRKCSASRSTLQFKCPGFDYKRGNTDMALRISYKCFNNTEIIKSTRHCRNHLNASESRPFERFSSTCYTFLFTFCRVYKRWYPYRRRKCRKERKYIKCKTREWEEYRGEGRFATEVFVSQFQSHPIGSNSLET